MKKIILLPHILTAFLFIGCGDSGSGSSAFELSTNSSEYIVVEGMKKDVRLNSNRENVTFEFVDKSEAPDTELNNGVVEYRSPQNSGEEDQKIIVKAVDSKGDESQPLTLSFQTVSSNISVTRGILKTGSNDGNAGVDRNFIENSDGNIIDPFGNIWENRLEEKSLENKLYINAKNRCDILRLINKGTQWRVPTADEMLNLMDYSKASGSSMLDDTFVDINLTSWVSSNDGRYLVVTQSNGLVQEMSFLDKYPVRCINASINEDKHIVSTNRYNDRETVDFSTGLQWSAMTDNSLRKIVDDVNQTAAEYCSEYDNASGWRLPNINEVRSIIENGTISTNILGNYTIIVSSTPYNNSDENATLAHYTVGVEDNKISYGVSYADILYSITCVKER